MPFLIYILVRHKCLCNANSEKSICFRILTLVMRSACEPCCICVRVDFLHATFFVKRGFGICKHENEISPKTKKKENVNEGHCVSGVVESAVAGETIIG